MDPTSVEAAKIADPCFWKRVKILSLEVVETCPCSSQRIARPGVDLPGQRGIREAGRGKAILAAFPNVGTGWVPAIFHEKMMMSKKKRINFNQYNGDNWSTLF